MNINIRRRFCRGSPLVWSFFWEKNKKSSFDRPLCGTSYNTVPLVCSIGSAKYVKFNFHYA